MKSRRSIGRWGWKQSIVGHEIARWKTKKNEHKNHLRALPDWTTSSPWKLPKRTAWVEEQWLPKNWLTKSQQNYIHRAQGNVWKGPNGPSQKGFREMTEEALPNRPSHKGLREMTEEALTKWATRGSGKWPRRPYRTKPQGTQPRRP